MVSDLPVGFDLFFPTDLSENAWEVIRLLQRERELDELCPSESHWSYVARTENARRLCHQLGLFQSVKLVCPLDTDNPKV